MWCSKAYLQLCQQLANKGLVWPDEVGVRLGRGFADLGSEEFILLAGGQLLSLYSAKKSTLADDQRKFFFWLPTADQLASEIDRRGIDLLRIDCVERRSWQALGVRAASRADMQQPGELVTAEATELELALALLLDAALSCEKTNKPAFPDNLEQCR